MRRRRNDSFDIILGIIIVIALWLWIELWPLLLVWAIVALANKVLRWWKK